MNLKFLPAVSGLAISLFSLDAKPLPPHMRRGSIRLSAKMPTAPNWRNLTTNWPKMAGRFWRFPLHPKAKGWFPKPPPSSGAQGSSDCSQSLQPYGDSQAFQNWRQPNQSGAKTAVRVYHPPCLVL